MTLCFGTGSGTSVVFCKSNVTTEFLSNTGGSIFSSLECVLGKRNNVNALETSVLSSTYFHHPLTRNSEASSSEFLDNLEEMIIIQCDS